MLRREEGCVRCCRHRPQFNEAAPSCRPSPIEVGTQLLLHTAELAPENASNQVDRLVTPELVELGPHRLEPGEEVQRQEFAEHARLDLNARAGAGVRRHAVRITVVMLGTNSQRRGVGRIADLAGPVPVGKRVEPQLNGPPVVLGRAVVLVGTGVVLHPHHDVVVEVSTRTGIAAGVGGRALVIADAQLEVMATGERTLRVAYALRASGMDGGRVARPCPTPAVPRFLLLPVAVGFFDADASIAVGVGPVAVTGGRLVIAEGRAR